MHYVALLRGIGPGNPNMRNDKLRAVFEDLGFHNVASIISSGNIIFESDSADIPALEKKVEEGLFSTLGFHSTTIIRSRQQLERLVKKKPFGAAEHTPATNLNVTFLKTKRTGSKAAPETPKGQAYSIVALYDDAVCSVIDITADKTPNLMGWLEKEFSKDITTRTWKTVERILAKWQAAD